MFIMHRRCYLYCRYDSLTGICTMQRTLGYEKGSVLFNIGALYSQMATAQVTFSASPLNDMPNGVQRVVCSVAAL